MDHKEYFFCQEQDDLIEYNRYLEYKCLLEEEEQRINKDKCEEEISNDLPF